MLAAKPPSLSLQPSLPSNSLPLRSPILVNAKPTRLCSTRSTHLTSQNTTTPPPVAAAHAPQLSDAQVRVEILSEALPYIQRFRGKTIVVKYGGAAMTSTDLQQSVIKDLVLLSCVGINPVLVHGGGPEINARLRSLGIEPVFRDGLRVTDGPTMEVVQMVLCGFVNKNLVTKISLAGARACGLCGADKNLVTARPSSDAAMLGFVGEVAHVDPSALRSDIAGGCIPVIASVAPDENNQMYNVKADTFAGEIAAALGAEKLILLTDVPGILEDRNDARTLIKEIDIVGIIKMIDEGKVAGGMIPKVKCCKRALAQGVKTASIIDGRVSHSLLLEILTDEGVGTMITDKLDIEGTKLCLLVFTLFLYSVLKTC